MLCSISQAALLLAHPNTVHIRLDLQSGFFHLPLPLPKPLDEVGIHQLINSQIKSTVHERRQASISEREAVRYEAALPHAVLIDTSQERFYKI